MPESMPLYMTVARVADEMHVNHDTVRRLFGRGKLKGVQFGPRGPIRIFTQSLLDLQEGLEPSTPATPLSESLLEGEEEMRLSIRKVGGEFCYVASLGGRALSGKCQSRKEVFEEILLLMEGYNDL